MSVVYLEKVASSVALVTHGQQRNCPRSRRGLMSTESLPSEMSVDYGERVGEGGHGSGQLVGCEHAVVERAVDGGTYRQQTDAHDDEWDYFPHFISSSI